MNGHVKCDGIACQWEMGLCINPACGNVSEFNWSPMMHEHYGILWEFNQQMNALKSLVKGINADISTMFEQNR